MKLRIIGLVLFASLASWAPAQEKAKGPAGVKVVRDLAYGTHERHKLDLYMPENGAKQPLVVWIHGGGWAAGSKDGAGPAHQLTQHGYTVASINYRLTNAAPFPAQIHDCKGAIRWLKAHAKEYGYDADHIGVFGASAGGHLVALLGLTADNKELAGDLNPGPTNDVQAVVDWFGPTDFLNWGEKGKLTPGNTANSAVDKLMGGSIEDHRDLAKKASPITYSRRDCPPILLVHGDKDGLVPLQQSQVLYDDLRKWGADATLHVVTGGGHGQGFGAPEATVVLKFLDLKLKMRKS